MNPCAAAERSSDSRGWPGQSKYADEVAPPWIATMTARGSGDRGDQRGHRHAVDHDDAGRGPSVLIAGRAHASVRSSITPLGVRPPLLATATWASATWRSPASPRSWVTASWIRPMPWVRPCDS